jgi:lysophospholipase L1-like esterase
LPQDVDRGTVSFDGSAEVYGIQLDAASGGVAVDNVALRGSAGNIFTAIAPQVMEEGLARSDVRLILLQFGGNAMPGITSDKGVSLFVKKIVEQFDYFRSVAPDARLLFVGPADMCKSVNGKLVSWPRLRMLGDSLRIHCLENGVAYWDTFGMMGGEGSMFHWVHHNPPLAGPDHIHFTHRGAAEVGSALARSLLTYYDFFRLRRELPAAAVQEYMDSVLKVEMTPPRPDTTIMEEPR